MVEQVELLPVTQEFRRGLAEAIRIIRETRDGFLSEQYAVDQPMSSFQERFACDQCAQAIEDEFALGTKEQEALRLATLTPASSGQELREAYMVLREALFDICDLTSEDGLANRQEIWGVASEALDRIGPDGAALNRTPDPVAGPSGDRAALAAIERSERILLRPSIVPDLEGNFGPELAFDPTPCPEWPAGAWQCGLPDHDLYYGATPNDALAAWEAAQLRATQAGIGEEG